MRAKHCAFPGCVRKTRRLFNDYCTGHMPMTETPGVDMYCQLCGFGPRRSLAAHIHTFHDDIGTAEYKKRFGWDSVVSTSVRRVFRSQWDDRIAAGINVKEINPRLKGTCRNGHRLAGVNVYFVRHGGSGPYSENITRRCRKCRRVSDAKRRKIAPWRKRPRKCVICRQEFLPVQKHQRCCPAVKCRREQNRRRTARLRAKWAASAQQKQ